MGKSINSVLNELLIEIFNDILVIEERAIKEEPLNDISITEMHTIEAVGMYEPRTMTVVAKDLDITVGTLTTAINNLVRKEYVSRERDDKDRRVVKIKLTKKGKLAYRIHEKFHLDMIKHTIEGLTEEEEVVLADALKKLNKYFKTNYNLKK
ncbi:MarR family winged helix-turn-helix transcriptional regulator [Clostridium sp. DL1XJH146]